DPSQYISYRDHVPIALGGNHRGQQTIDALGLGRPELNADRAEHLEYLKQLHVTASHAEVPAELRISARAVLVRMAAATGKYSLMCRAAIEGLGGMPAEPARRL